MGAVAPGNDDVIMFRSMAWSAQRDDPPAEMVMHGTHMNAPCT